MHERTQKFCNTMLAGNRARLNDDRSTMLWNRELDKRPMVSSSHNCDFVHTLRRNISIALFILISLDNLLYLET